jgi:yecA family protein
MQIQTKIPAFADFSNSLMEADAMTNPAEIHGVLAGLICTGQRLDGKFWLDAILRLLEARASLSQANRNVVIELYNAICQQLSSFDADFYLLLPSDEQTLTDRARALSRWCDGFLYGLTLSSSGSSILDSTPEEVQEALRCIAEVAKLDFEKVEITDQSTEIDRFTYQSTVEYIRTAVMLMYDEFSKKPKYLH